MRLPRVLSGADRLPGRRGETWGRDASMALTELRESFDKLHKDAGIACKERTSE
jgi:hypothetical protein